MDDICKRAIAKWGAAKQLNMIIEECAELQKAISKYIRYEHNGVWRLKVIEEIADVEIMLEQAKLMLTTPDEYARVLENKKRNIESLILDDDPMRKLK